VVNNILLKSDKFSVFVIIDFILLFLLNKAIQSVNDRLTDFFNY
jgi:hypothetical protein